MKVWILTLALIGVASAGSIFKLGRRSDTEGLEQCREKLEDREFFDRFFDRVSERLGQIAEQDVHAKRYLVGFVLEFFQIVHKDCIKEGSDGEEPTVEQIEKCAEEKALSTCKQFGDEEEGCLYVLGEIEKVYKEMANKDEGMDDGKDKDLDVRSLLLKLRTALSATLK